MQQRLGDVVQVLLVGQLVAAIDIVAVGQQALHVGHDIAGGTVKPETASLVRVLDGEQCKQQQHSYLLFEDVLKQAAGERAVALQLLQIDKVPL